MQALSAQRQLQTGHGGNKWKAMRPTRFHLVVCRLAICVVLLLNFNLSIKPVELREGFKFTAKKQIKETVFESNSLFDY